MADNSIPTPESALLAKCRSEIDFVRALLFGVNMGLIGTLGAATFVSAFYYPTIWLLVILSVTVQRHVRALIDDISDLEHGASA